MLGAMTEAPQPVGLQVGAEAGAVMCKSNNWPGELEAGDGALALQTLRRLLT